MEEGIQTQYFSPNLKKGKKGTKKDKSGFAAKIVKNLKCKISKKSRYIVPFLPHFDENVIK